MEEIRSFILDHHTRNLPFYIELAGVTYPDINYGIRRECSEFYVLEYIINGSGYVHVNDQSFSVSAGDVYILPLGCKCYYYADSKTPYKKIWMNVNGEICKQLFRIYNLNTKYHFENLNVYPLFEKFLNLCKETNTSTQHIFSKCSCVFFEIIQALFNASYVENEINEYVLKAKHYCDMNLYTKITVEDVAGYISLSVSQLNRLFKKEYGTTVYSYLLNCRIETAKSLLKGTALSISEISEKLIFTDEHYFSNIFKKKVGLAPSAYRKL